ncbi:MAG: DNA alkylation repair protein [Marinilabiliaceae bacterium]|mgnify:CR=1 FL=1|nr:DNA alkylation repair protein [Marinilabiliaceae bacterium]
MNSFSKSERASDIELAIMQMQDAEKAKVLMRFFKTGPGQYGEGDRFLGVTNPKIRLVVRESWRQTSLEEAAELVHSVWHEVRCCGLLIMVEHYKYAMRRHDEQSMLRMVDLYISLHDYINNWDLVDLTVTKTLGDYEVTHPKFKVLDEWIKPGHTLWQRRISMVATWAHVRKDEFCRLIVRAEMLLNSHDDLLHKAAGWMLREMYKRSELGEAELISFLDKHIGDMPAVMLSYACEKMSEDERIEWRKRRKA